jgi:hypothetical protein
VRFEGPAAALGALLRFDLCLLASVLTVQIKKLIDLQIGFREDNIENVFNALHIHIPVMSSS